jgi:ketosteroid isomerase-like protein
MSRENVEIVRAIFAGWEQGDFEAGVEWFDPEITFESFMPDAGDKVTAHGLAEIQAFTRDWFTQWQAYRAVGDEFREVGKDSVLVSGRQIGTGRHSGVEVESPAYSLWTIKEGRVVKMSLHYDRDEAMKAAAALSR